jgi:hypothetical protein
VALNCINGYFVDIANAGAGHVNFSFAEQMVKKDSRGALAMWAPSALGSVSDYSSMGDWLFRIIFIDRNRFVGNAATTAVIAAVTQPFQPADIKNVREMTLFGDPATELALDSDGDGLLDSTEESAGSSPVDGDTDDDGVGDAQEANLGGDADGDGLVNGADPDSDNDCVFDGTETGATAPAPGTNTGAGFFVPDADPLTTTDPLDPDTDGGGQADGSEDLDHDGALDGGEGNPLAAGDDVPLGEVTNVLASVSGSDLVLAWDDLSAGRPCVLYRVYVSNTNRPVTFGEFTLLAVVSTPGYTHTGGAAPGLDHSYLIEAFDPLDGPLGHYGQ